MHTTVAPTVSAEGLQSKAVPLSPARGLTGSVSREQALQALEQVKGTGDGEISRKHPESRRRIPH